LKCAPLTGPQQRDQGCQDRNRRAGIRDERDGDVTAGQSLGHDPGTDHRCREQ